MLGCFCSLTSQSCPDLGHFCFFQSLKVPPMFKFDQGLPKKKFPIWVWGPSRSTVKCTMVKSLTLDQVAPQLDASICLCVPFIQLTLTHACSRNLISAFLHLTLGLFVMVKFVWATRSLWQWNLITLRLLNPDSLRHPAVSLTLVQEWCGGPFKYSWVSHANNEYYWTIGHVFPPFFHKKLKLNFRVHWHWMCNGPIIVYCVLYKYSFFHA